MTDDTYTYKTDHTYQDYYTYRYEYQNSTGWAFRQYGWICPKCGRVWAPWVPRCDCVRRDEE